MSAALPPSLSDRLLRVRGTVQGVGFRPFVLRTARELGVRGWVRNDASGVLVRAIGDEAQLASLADTIVAHPPSAARVTAVEWLEERDVSLPADEFVIRESPDPGTEIETAAPPDLAPCPDCRRELADPGDRRHGYAFINCTQCGPRYSILEALPYDRRSTTMRCFRLCPDCAREYADPTDRRFHAEPNACPVCGPRCVLTTVDGGKLAEASSALDCAAALLRGGGIVAVKGVGGYHLLVDATDSAAVAELRRRKHREEKPLAVLFRDLGQLHEWTLPTSDEELLASSPQAPIVLVRARPERPLAPGVAPGNPWIGALLPPSPLHVLLLQRLAHPVVATSANLSEEPLCTDDDEARQRLGGIADAFLGHDRVIARPVDDSVVRSDERGAAIVLRRARGYAPSPLRLPAALSLPLLCTGAQMKSTVALATGTRVVVSPHVGDLEGAATQEAFRRTVDMLAQLGGRRFEEVVCDKHPDYASTRYALDLGLPVTGVQHHLAHVLAVLLEHTVVADDVLGVAWDGTGFGEDGTIWGGEFIRLHRGRAERVARLRPFPLIGGDAAARDCRRVAWTLGTAAGIGAGGGLGRFLDLAEREEAIFAAMQRGSVNSPRCSSVGRLFDGVGALLGLGRRNRFEGQTALALEIAADRCFRASMPLAFPVVPASEGARWDVDWAPAVAAAWSGRVRPEETAYAFHAGLAAAIVAVAERSACHQVALAGGCFQNALLLRLTRRALEDAGFAVLTARELPPNDGAISAGQALGALWRLTTVDIPRGVAAFGSGSAS
jgi:hydrogenase maturation protein HypF